MGAEKEGTELRGGVGGAIQEKSVLLKTHTSHFIWKTGNKLAWGIKEVIRKLTVRWPHCAIKI